MMISLFFLGWLQGLSEPVGALLALLFIKPWLTPLLLQYMLAFVGGIMVGFPFLHLRVSAGWPSDQHPGRKAVMPAPFRRVKPAWVVHADLGVRPGAVAGGAQVRG